MGIERYLSQQQFEELFPNRNPIFTYQNLLSASKPFTNFASSGTDEQRKREIAAFLAHISHETGGLQHSEELSRASSYCRQPCHDFPCFPGQSYHGRGPLQLSWNYNYGQASERLFGDKQVLLKDPSQVSRDGRLAFKTAFWFWMTTQPPKMSCHDAILRRGFGETTKTINGGFECGKGYITKQALSRVREYEKIAKALGATCGGNLHC